MKNCRIMNNAGNSSYFRGQYRNYGLYQWNIKYYGFESEYEIGKAVDYVFGSYETCNGKSGFYYVNDLLGRCVEASIEGRSGGWFVIHERLSKKELETLDMYIQQHRSELPNFLAEERAFLKEEIA